MIDVFKLALKPDTGKKLMAERALTLDCVRLCVIWNGRPTETG